jgi:hypothetical protein
MPKMTSPARLIVLMILALGCTGSRAEPLSDLQQRLYTALKRNGAISPDTRLVALGYVCSLSFGGKSWPVVNTIEHVRGAQVPRALNRIVILDTQLNVVRKVSYADQHPLFCKGNRLFLNGELAIDNVEPRGNVLVFSGTAEVVMETIEPNELPVEPTGQRKTFEMK